MLEISEPKVERRTSVISIKNKMMKDFLKVAV